MRLLLDAAFPAADFINDAGVVYERWAEDLEDAVLVEFAIEHGFAGLVLFGPDMLIDDDLINGSAAANLLLVCSVADDPFAAEAHLVSHAHDIARKLAESPRGAWWLRKDGLVEVHT